MKKFFLYLALSFMLFAQTITIYESPTCECCTKWSSYLKKNGFKTKDVKVANFYDYKNKYNIPENMRSCHTGYVEGYFLEGHIPAEDIQKLLQQKPNDIIGLSVPNMPIGSPGMEQGDYKENYNTYAIKKDGSIIIWSRH
ncbi:DUF411 domain-containing protein [Helicobacter anatolicus]|uniref:DUF411 domain-containing protein n=1 Tax=Helicobacter anatolicus TaxID=2905874 RepID=UPI001E3536F8|nr:DUF411 domain-containing protein [Helicobacter anatolicus]